VTRRSFSIAAALLLAALAVPLWPQSQLRIPVVGVLRASYLAADDPVKATLIAAMRELGYVEGENIHFEQRFANNRADLLPGLAKELARMKVDVILATTADATRAAMQATAAIPIVMVVYDRDPVAAGLVRSLAQPGGNVTGVFSRQPELAGKRLELLKEMLPELASVAVLSSPGSARQIEALAAPARALGLRLNAVEVRDTKRLESAFQRAQRMNVQALVVPFSPLFHTQRVRIATLALEARLPTLCQEYDFVEAGALLSYAPDREAVIVRVAHFIDRVL
jgi:putative ABC transport system substrate-binding protein